MRKIQKNKRGFTLIEMVLVIAIIVILASVLFVAIGGYISKANKVASVASVRNSRVDSLTAKVDADMAAALADS